MNPRKCVIAVLVAVLLPVASLPAQENSRWQARLQAGMYYPASADIQDIYATAKALTAGLTMPLGTKSRIRAQVHLASASGDPYFSTPDFYAGDVAHLRMRTLGFMLETRGHEGAGPALWPGVGVVFVTGSEKIDGVSDSALLGVGGVVGINPEIALTKTLVIQGEIAFRFLDGTFREGKTRYRQNLSGVVLTLGLAWRFRQE